MVINKMILLGSIKSDWSYGGLIGTFHSKSKALLPTEGFWSYLFIPSIFNTVGDTDLIIFGFVNNFFQCVMTQALIG